VVNRPDQPLRSRLQYAGVRLSIAAAISVPVVLLGIAINHYFADYRQAAWYGQLARWYGREAQESAQKADGFLRRAELADSREEAEEWTKKSAALHKRTQELEENKRRALEKSRELSRTLW